MTRAIPAHKVSDTTRKGADKEFHRTHSGIGTSIFNRLIRNDGVRADDDIESASTMVNNGEGHEGALRSLAVSGSQDGGFEFI